MCLMCSTAVLVVTSCCYFILRRASCDEQSDVWWRSCGICSLSDGTWICTGGMSASTFVIVLFMTIQTSVCKLQAVHCANYGGARMS